MINFVIEIRNGNIRFYYSLNGETNIELLPDGIYNISSAELKTLQNLPGDIGGKYGRSIIITSGTISHDEKTFLLLDSCFNTVFYGHHFGSDGLIWERLVTNNDLRLKLYIVPKPFENNSIFTSLESWGVYIYKSGKVVILRLNIYGNMLANNENNVLPKLAVPWYTIEYNNDNKSDAVNILNNPTIILGNITSPFCFLFRDTVGDSPLSGGVSCVFGYAYAGNNYGTQLAVRYDSSTILIRNQHGGQWSDWKTISA